MCAEKCRPLFNIIINYSLLMHGLKLADIEINRKMLAEMAVNDPEGFTALAEIAKKAVA